MSVCLLFYSNPRCGQQPCAGGLTMKPAPFMFTAFSSVIILSALSSPRNNPDYPRALKAQIHSFSVLRQ